MEREKLIETMRDLMKVQGADGNWNYDPYMHGMYNGMEMFLAMVEGREPIFRDAPVGWLSDIPSEHNKVAEAVEGAH